MAHAAAVRMSEANGEISLSLFLWLTCYCSASPEVGGKIHPLPIRCANNMVTER